MSTAPWREGGTQASPFAEMSADELRAAFEAAGSFAELARSFGTSTATVRKWCARAGVTSPAPVCPIADMSADEITALLEEAGSWSALARRVGAAETSVRRICARHGITSPSPAATFPLRAMSDDELQAAVNEAGSFAELARRIGRRSEHVLRHCQRRGVVSPYGLRSRQFFSSATDAEVKEAVDRAGSLPDLARSLDVSLAAVIWQCRKRGIQSPDRRQRARKGER